MADIAKCMTHNALCCFITVLVVCQAVLVAVYVILRSTSTDIENLPYLDLAEIGGEWNEPLIGEIFLIDSTQKCEGQDQKKDSIDLFTYVWYGDRPASLDS